MAKDIYKKIQKEHNDDFQQEALEQSSDWYRLNSLLGNTWANWFVCAGGREVGKSFACSEFIINQWRKYGRRFYWIRLSEISKDKLLQNNCDKLFNAVLRRRYNLDTVRVGNDVYEVLKRDDKGKVLKKKKMGTVMALSEMAKDKGIEYYNHEYTGWYNIIVDEICREKREKDTFDITYNLANQLENIVRSKWERVRVIMCCNMCTDLADVLPHLDFIPVEYGRYKLKRKNTVIDYIPITDNYKKRRARALANQLLGFEDGNFNNTIARDTESIYCGKCTKPTAIIKFSKEKSGWFTVWDGKIIAKYKNEKIDNTIAMRRYIDEVFNIAARDSVFEMLDARYFFYKDLVSQSLFLKNMKEVKGQ